ncbi:Uncharacterized protein GBIM_21060, partial [Gryllus bimaculatus]
ANENGRTALHEAALVNDTLSAALLLRAGAAADQPDVNGHTALHMAAIANAFSFTTVLLAAGADPACADHNGLTPAQMAEDEALCTQITLAHQARACSAGAVQGQQAASAAELQADRATLADRAARAARAARSDRSYRSDRSGRYDRSGGSDRSDRGDRSGGLNWHLRIETESAVFGTDFWK